MKKNILFIAILCAFSSAFAQVPAVSATTKWAVIDGNATWVPSALDFKNYCLIGLEGGTTGQVLTKNSGTDYDYSWAAGGGGASDALGTGFTSGGGTGAIPSGTSAEAGGFSYPVYLSFNNSSHQTRDAFNLSGFWATNSSDDVGYFGYYDEEGLPFPLIEAHDVSGNYSRLFLRPTASDFSTAGDLSFSAVGNQVFSGQLITLSASNGVQMPTLDSATKEGLTPSNGVEVWDTDLDGKCVYDGTKWFRLSQESTPTIAVGAGAGTGATVSVVGNDIEGVITLTGGTGATASATVFTLTFFDSYTTAPHGVIITPADTDAANLPAGRIPAFDTISTTTFTMINAAVNGITNAVVYKYAYRVIQ